MAIGKEVNWKRLINSESAVKYNKGFDIYSASVDSFTMSPEMRQYEMAKTAILEAIHEANLYKSGYAKEKVSLCIGESKINLFNNIFFSCKYSF
ncbi:MAG: hypothetical protein LBL16_03430 [Endomicrobium sp.]|nr:hypothetical protein [Endomicrobium sp.]